MDKIRIALAGAGNIAQNAHLKAYAGRDDVQVVAVCDLNLARAQACAEKFGIPRAFPGIREMLDQVACDAVDICVWNRAHRDIAVEAAGRGLHILCEKPMALSLEHAEEMRRAVESAGVTFMMAMPRRFFSQVRYVNGMIGRGEMGNPYYAKATMIRRRGTPLGWFTDTQKSGGGPVIDIGVHAIDCAWFLLGRPRPTRVSAFTSYAIGDYKTLGVSRWVALDSDVTAFDTEDSAAGIFHFENGAAMAFDVSWAMNLDDADETVVLGDKAGARINHREESIAIFTEADGYLTDNRPHVPPVDPYEAEIDHFLSCLKTGAAPDPGLCDGVTLMRMLTGIYQSAKEGREICL